MEVTEKYIDLEKAIRNSDSKFFKSLPRFVISLIRKIVCEDELNATIYRSRHLETVPFIVDVLKGWKVEVTAKGLDNLDRSKRYIFASNHPLGGIDALSFCSVAGQVYPDIISPANQLLYYIPNLRPMILGVNVFGRQTRETAAKLNELFESDKQVFIFPAGEVSRRKKGVISDIAWQKSFVSKAIEHKRDIIPVHISGHNSGFFYFIANLRKALGIKMYIETVLLPREMLKRRGKPVTVTFGQPVSWESLTAGKTHTEWAQHIKALVYDLPVKGR